MHIFFYLRQLILVNIFLFSATAVTGSGQLLQGGTLEINIISVDPETNFVSIFWDWEEGDTPADLIIIHRNDPDNPEEFFVVDAVSPDQSFFLDTEIDASGRQVRYYVSAFDGEGESIGSSKVHGTFFLNSHQQDICAREITILWDDYVITESAGAQDPLPVPFEQVIVFASVNDGELEEVGNADFGSQSYTLQNAGPGLYRFYIKAIDNEGELETFSNYLEVVSTSLVMPEFSYIRAVDVINDQRIEVRLYADQQVASPSYTLYRSQNPFDDFVAVETISSDQAGIAFSDQDADPHSGLWYYKVEVIDSCQVPVMESQLSSSLFLYAQQQGMFSNLLEWDHQPAWGGGVQVYEIWRQLPYENDFSLKETVEGGINTYEDNLVDIPGEHLSGETKYRIQGIEGGGNPYDFQEVVKSNIVSINREEVIFVPNAFRPDSHEPKNRVFKPSMTFVGVQEYRLQVFNRWGQQIFVSDNPDIGWSGESQGEKSPPGVYPWLITYRDNSGSMKEKRGVVKLIR